MAYQNWQISGVRPTTLWKGASPKSKWAVSQYTLCWLDGLVSCCNLWSKKNEKVNFRSLRTISLKFHDLNVLFLLYLWRFEFLNIYSEYSQPAFWITFGLLLLTELFSKRKEKKVVSGKLAPTLPLISCAKKMSHCRRQNKKFQRRTSFFLCTHHFSDDLVTLGLVIG